MKLASNHMETAQSIFRSEIRWARFQGVLLGLVIALAVASTI